MKLQELEEKAAAEDAWYPEKTRQAASKQLEQNSCTICILYAFYMHSIGNSAAFVVFWGFLARVWGYDLLLLLAGSWWQNILTN